MPHAAVIVFPGTNREHDMAVALQQAGFTTELVWHRAGTLPKCDLVGLPGGFSYGDYLRTGAMAAHSPIMQEIKAHARQGRLVLGICNGFQILCESGLLPGVLLRNNHLKFTCKWIHAEIARTDTAFTKAYQTKQVIRIPIAHGDGNYTADAETIKKLEAENRIAMRYVAANDEVNFNPNGSQANIVGVYSEKLNVLGMMPHPEDAIAALHSSTDGAGLFQSLYQAVA